MPTGLYVGLSSGNVGIGTTGIAGTSNAVNVTTSGAAGAMTVLANGNIGIGTTLPSSSLHVESGGFYSPGSVVQCVTTLYTDATTYTAPGTITPTEMTVLNVTITPKRANSKIVLQWMINGEIHENAVFLVYRGSTAIGFNTGVGNIQVSGVTSAPYDTNLGTTPQNIIVNWIDLPNTVSSITYSVRVRSSNTGSSFLMRLNRTELGGIDSGYENLCSTGVALEVCV